METYDTALILGYGRSGRAAERLLNGEGTETQVLSRETAGDAELAKALKERQHGVCIVSPGFPLVHPWMRAVQDAGIPLLSELELGWSRHKGRTVAITGSNGKSTAVKWVHETLLEAGKKAEIGGNYGIPACETVLKHPEMEWLVLEVSSFQLETISRLQADIKVVLNIHPNHLDRHGNMETYWRTKARIFGSISLPEDACLVPISWLDQFRQAAGSDRNWITFGNSDLADYHFHQGIVYRKTEKILDLTGTLFDNPAIGACTGAAMGGIATVAKLSAENVESAAKRFRPLPYRLQKLGEIGGVAYVNDSKATNLAAMAAAVAAVGKGVHLIAGGLPKESDYTFVKEILAERVRRIYLTGQASRAMYQAWNGVCPCVECGTLKEAFNTAKDAAETGETILLSPGCASFDQFSSFEERGAYFDALYHGALQAGGDAV